MRKARNLASALLAGLAILLAGSAHAATYFAEARIGARHEARESESPTQAAIHFAAGEFARGTAGDAVVGARVQTERRTLHIAGASFSETYRLIGDGDDLVPVILTTLVSLRGQGRFESGADFDLVQAGEDLLDLDYAIARNSRRVITRKVTVRREIWLDPNVDFVFTLATYAEARQGLGAAQVGRPVLRVDPDFADRYRLVRSADLPPSGAVPEPGAWALLLLGFGGAGGLLRRQTANRRRAAGCVA